VENDAVHRSSRRGHGVASRVAGSRAPERYAWCQLFGSTRRGCLLRLRPLQLVASKVSSSVSASHGEGERGRCSSSAPFFRDWQVISSHFGPPQARNHKPTCHPSHFMYLLTCRSGPLCFQIFTSSTALRGAACPTPAPPNLQAIPTTARYSLLDCATQPVDSSAPCSAVNICHVPHNVWSP